MHIFHELGEVNGLPLVLLDRIQNKVFPGDSLKLARVDSGQAGPPLRTFGHVRQWGSLHVWVG